MDKKLYIGVDVSKKTLDLAFYDGVTVDWNNGHIKVTNDDAGYRKIDQWLEKLDCTKDDVLLCMEYTGLYNHNFRLWLESEGIMYGMIEPRKMHLFEPDLAEGQRSLDRIKTDEMDSFRIAIYCEQNRRRILSRPSRLPSQTYFKLKRLIAERRQYVKQSVLYKEQLHDISVYDTESTVARKETQLESLKTALKATDREILACIAEDESIQRNYDLLTSIMGIGLVVAVETIVLTENFTAISNPRKYACYIGIAPFKAESGTTVRKATRVSKKGFSQAKADLSQSALSAIVHDATIRKYWLRKRQEKKGGIVLNAIKFKLVLRMFAVIRRGTPFVEMDTYSK